MKSLVKILTKKKLKISFAESCTGGLLASSITSISGASKIFNLENIRNVNDRILYPRRQGKNSQKNGDDVENNYYFTTLFLQ